MQISELKLAKDLIRKPSVTPKDAGAINLLAKNLKSIGFKCKFINFKKVKNLYAKLGKASPNFCYAGHTDVVPPGNINEWTVNPFKPTVKNNRLIGRGANDMKASIACFVAAVSKFKNKNKNFKGSISLLITGDEEGIAINGTKRVVKYLKKKRERINFCIVGEPTNPNKLGEMIKIGRRGSLTGKIEVSGVQGHVAYPEWTLNPINPLTSILDALCNLELDQGTEDFPPSNMEIVNISSSQGATNVVPQTATGVFNIRYNINHTKDSLQSMIQEIISKSNEDGKYKIDISFNNSAEPFLTQKGKFTNIVKSSVDEITGMNSALTTTGGTSDARFFKDYCEVAEFGLIGETAHQIDENVNTHDIHNLKDVYLLILKKYFA